MCGIQYQHEVDSGGPHDSLRFYNRIEDLIANEKCHEECGIVELELAYPTWVVKQNFPKK